MVFFGFFPDFTDFHHTHKAHSLNPNFGTLSYPLSYIL